jgi:hypothetical protein
MPTSCIEIPTKFTQIGILGLKIYHLATLVHTYMDLLTEAFTSFVQSKIEMEALEVGYACRA